MEYKSPIIVMNYAFVAFVFLLISFSSCKPKKTRFSKADLSWIDIYREGDTLIFKSPTDELDTSIIIKKEVYHSEPALPVEKYKHQWGKVWYQNKSLSHQIL